MSPVGKIVPFAHFFRNSLIKMTSIERLLQNNKAAEDLLESLKSQVINYNAMLHLSLSKKCTISACCNSQ